MSAEPLFLQTWQPQFPRPLLIGLVLPTLYQLRCSSLDMFQHISNAQAIRQHIYCIFSSSRQVFFAFRPGLWVAALRLVFVASVTQTVFTADTVLVAEIQTSSGHYLHRAQILPLGVFLYPLIREIVICFHRMIHLRKLSILQLGGIHECDDSHVLYTH